MADTPVEVEDLKRQVTTKRSLNLRNLVGGVLICVVFLVLMYLDSSKPIFPQFWLESRVIACVVFFMGLFSVLSAFLEITQYDWYKVIDSMGHNTYEPKRSILQVPIVSRAINALACIATTLIVYSLFYGSIVF